MTTTHELLIENAGDNIRGIVIEVDANGVRSVADIAEVSKTMNNGPRLLARFLGHWDPVLVNKDNVDLGRATKLETKVAKIMESF